MLRKALCRALIGFPLGVFLGNAITVMISLIQNDGKYYAVVPSLVDQMGSELNAVVLQFILSGILGAGFAGFSVVWENDEWSILKRTLVHLLGTSLTFLPVAYVNHWMEPTPGGVLAYMAIWFGIYLVIWLAQYLFWKNKVQQINQRLQSK